MNEYQKQAKRATKTGYLLVTISLISYTYSLTNGSVLIGYAAGIVGGTGIGMLQVKRVIEVLGATDD